MFKAMIENRRKSAFYISVREKLWILLCLSGMLLMFFTKMSKPTAVVPIVPNISNTNQAKAVPSKTKLPTISVNEILQSFIQFQYSTDFLG